MKDAFILDLNVLEEQNLSIIEFMTLLKLRGTKGIDLVSDDVILNDLQDKQFIKIAQDNDEKIIILREKSKLLIDFLLIEGSQSDYKQKKISKQSSRVINDGFDEFIDTYRNLWKNLKAGTMGSPSSCKAKMLRWMKDNPSYSKEDILKAAKIYIASLNNYTYLQAADYFIYKKDGREESSRLSAFIDEIEVDNTDWTTSLR